MDIFRTACSDRGSMWLLIALRSQLMSDSLTKTLQDMASNTKGRSQTSRLRDVFPAVEKALRAGVSRQAVLAALNQDGFTLNLPAFDKALYRIRKEQVRPTAQPRPNVSHEETSQPESKRHPFSGLGPKKDSEVDSKNNFAHSSVPDLDRIYDRQKPEA